MLDAVRAVPRDRFVPEELRAEAWENVPLPIGAGQTISQPLVVARMCELLELRGDERVLDVGTGSGYHAALLARLAALVWSVEVHAELSAQAAANLAAAGIENVTLRRRRRLRAGCPSDAPFDAINVAAAAGPRVPPALEEPARRRRAARRAGRRTDEQRLVLERRSGRRPRASALERVRFVPLVERDARARARAVAGWSSPARPSRSGARRPSRRRR